MPAGALKEPGVTGPAADAPPVCSDQRVRLSVEAAVDLVESMDRFYHGFCNKTLWPLLHYFPFLTHYEEDYWREYKHVNRAFADAVLKGLRPDSFARLECRVKGPRRTIPG